MRLTRTRTMLGRVRARLAAEGGFTMITAVGALFVVSILSAAAIAAAQGDIKLSRYDQDDKQAYAAAEAGVNDYLAHLDADSNYWATCTGPVGNRYPGVNDQDFPETRRWRALPNSTNSDYSIELIPQNGATACSTSDPVGTMIREGNFQIRSTGRVKRPGTDTTITRRSVVATFRRTGFLDYLYFTDLENQDPTYLDLTLGDTPTRQTDASGTPIAGPDLRTWAADKCARHWWGTQAGGEGRKELPVWHGQFEYPAGTWTPPTGLDITTASTCGEITFGNDDRVNGPFHSNDDIRVCGTPGFGRVGGSDRVEVSGDGWRGCGGSTPRFTPELITSAPTLDLPPSNGAIKQQTDPDYLFSGKTTLRVDGANVTVENSQRNGGAAYTVPLPDNGVIYVQNIACSFGYQPGDTEAPDPNCGAARVKGSYSQDLTIAAEDDVIIEGDLTRDPTSSNAVLGLVANNFVRVWHPVDRSSEGCPNKADTPTNVKVDAAILSLAHSFTVDNYTCGSPLGKLTVNGVIAQKHRGVVGQGDGATIAHGYIKDYNYDERLRFRSPPYFLDPVQASWRILRQYEQSPAR